MMWWSCRKRVRRAPLARLAEFDGEACYGLLGNSSDPHRSALGNAFNEAGNDLRALVCGQAVHSVFEIAAIAA